MRFLTATCAAVLVSIAPAWALDDVTACKMSCMSQRNADPFYCTYSCEKTQTFEPAPEPSRQKTWADYEADREREALKKEYKCLKDCQRLSPKQRAACMDFC